MKRSDELITVQRGALSWLSNERRRSVLSVVCCDMFFFECCTTCVAGRTNAHYFFTPHRASVQCIYTAAELALLDSHT
jgi:hypothetical protein